MNIISYIALFSVILNLSIGIYLLSKNPKNKINIFFFLFVLSLIIFNIGEFLTRISITAEGALLWGKISYSVLVFGPCFALNFSLFFPRKIIPKRYDLISKYLMICVYLTGLIVYILFVYSASIQNVRYSEWGYRLPVSTSFFFLVIWFLIIIGLVFSYLVYKYFWGNISNIEKKQIQVVLIGGILLVIAAVGTNILPSIFNFNIFPMTSLFSSIFVIFPAYAIIKYNFLSISSTMIAKNILDIMNDSLIVVDGNENIVKVNKSTLNLLGYHKRELMNSSLKQIINLPQPEKRNDKKVFESKLFSVLFTGNDDCRLENIETEFITKEGKYIPVNLSSSIIYDNQSNLEGVIITARNLTEIKNLVRDLKKAKGTLEKMVKKRTLMLENVNKQLKSEIKKYIETEEKLKKSQRRIKQQIKQIKKLDALKTAFLNITSHELRTPMTAVKGYIQMLLKKTLGDLTEQQKQALDVVLRNTNRLDLLVQDILDTSQLESGIMKYTPGETNMVDLVKESLVTMKPFADSKGLMFEIDIDDKVPKLIADSNRIKQVLDNLTSNAIKFSPDESIINVNVKKDQDNVSVEIQDHGIGIPKDQQKKIFEPFYQVESGMNRSFGGTGLGLSISRGIILGHGGKLGIDSKKGKGSTFYFTLPLKPVQDSKGVFRKIDIFNVEDHNSEFKGK